jgi:uncharacterized membrane protein
VAGGLSGLFVVVGRVLSTDWGEDVMLLTTPALVVFWLTGVYLRQREESGTLGGIGYLVSTLGALLLVGYGFAMVVVSRLLGESASTTLMAGVGRVPLVAVDAPLVVGVMLLGVATIRAGVFPRGATVLWMIGVAQTVLIPVFPIGAVLLGAGLIWSSRSLWFGVTDGRVEPEETPQLSSAAAPERLLSLDALRGLIMILMAIDHASAIIGKSHSVEWWNVPLPEYGGTAAFLTRFVTHFCAPGFFFLMGAGMILFADSRRRSGWSTGKIVRHFAFRGLLLILLEQFLVNPLLHWRLAPTELGVLYGLGGVMIICALLVRLDRVILLGVGFTAILVIQVLPPFLHDSGIGFTPLTRLLLVPGYSGDWTVLYSIVPWLGVTALGMAFGRDLVRDRGKAMRRALSAGVVFLLLFPVVRLVGGFGNFCPPAGPGWIDFLNVVKYPPSLVFILLTLGGDLVLIYLFDRAGEKLERWVKPLLVFGGTALFFYFVHWYVYSAIGLFFLQISGNLPLVYLGWGAGLLMLYPICVSYRAFRRRTALNSTWRMI